MNWVKEIQERYAGKAVQEWERLHSTPITRIEYLITTRCLERYLPAEGLVLDAGSGPGRYTIDLAQKGYRMVMLDLIYEMLQLGQVKIAEGGVGDRAGLVAGNIVRLPFVDQIFDAVISLGAPLSHIPDTSERSKAVDELTRVLKPGGWLLLTGMQRLACYRGVVYWLDQGFFEQIMSAEDRANGIIQGTQVWYLFAPGELEGIIQDAGLFIVDRVGCEGIANHLPMEHLERVEADPRYGPVWREILLETCNVPSITGISNHLLVVAQKK